MYILCARALNGCVRVRTYRRGLRVVGSIILGNARASKGGTTTVGFHAFFICLCLENKVKSEDAENPIKSRQLIIYTIMEQQKIDMFLAQNAEKLPKDKVLVLKDALEKLDDSKAMFVQTVDFKDPTTILIISILLGFLGIDRFMLGEVGLGIAKLLTCGGCYIWWIIDMVNAQDLTRKYNYKKLQEALMMQGITIY